MKTLFFLLLFTSCTIFIPKIAGAQYKKGDLYGQVGLAYLSVYQFADGIISINSGRLPEWYLGATPAYTIGIKYFPKPTLGIGFTACYQEIRGTSNDYFSYSGAGVGFYKFNEHYYTLTADATFVAETETATQFYFLVGVGVTYVNRDYSETRNIISAPLTWRSRVYPTGQITPLGIKFGGKFAPFLEFGIGYKGLICTGFTFKLGGRKQKPKLEIE